MGKRLIIKGADFSENGIEIVLPLDLIHGAYTENYESSWRSDLTGYDTSRRVSLNNGLYVKTKPEYCIVNIILYSGMEGDMAGRFFPISDVITHPVIDQYNRTQEWSIYSNVIGNYPIVKLTLQRVDKVSPITLDENEIIDTIMYI